MEDKTYLIKYSPYNKLLLDHFIPLPNNTEELLSLFDNLLKLQMYN